MLPVRYAPYLYSVMRAVFGFIWLCHGLQKLFGMFGDAASPLVSLMGVAGVVELVVGTLIMVGWKTRPAAFLASGQMAVAYFLRHQPRGTWPIENGGELAVLFCFAFLYISAKGAGPLALDRR